MRTRIGTFVIFLTLAPLAAFADSGFYIGASAGGATLEADIGDIGIPGFPSDIDEDDTAIKVSGGYQFDLPVIDLGIELGYVDFGEPEIDVFNEVLLVDSSGVNAWGVATIDAGLIDVFGKLGMIAWEVDASLVDENISDDGTDIGYGLGAAFNLGSLQVRAEYEIYDLDGTDLSMLSLGVAFRF